jgi:lipopolysaccharide export system ATP-binding protein
MSNLQSIRITKAFKKRIVVSDVSIQVRQGEIVGLLGPNGAGKTTTFLMMLGLYKPDSGDILLNGEKITRDPVYVRARKGISFLPQEPSVFKGLSVEDNIASIIEMLPDRGDITVDAFLNEMGLTALRRRKAYLLSGGESRRLEIARSLVLEPNFLLLDEPFAGIDPIQISEIQQLILSFKNKGLGIIITDHNVREILKITDRSYIINKGEVIFQGNSQELISNEKVKMEYLGKEFKWN